MRYPIAMHVAPSLGWATGPQSPLLRPGALGGHGGQQRQQQRRRQLHRCIGDVFVNATAPAPGRVRGSCRYPRHVGRCLPLSLCRRWLRAAAVDSSSWSSEIERHSTHAGLTASLRMSGRIAGFCRKRSEHFASWSRMHVTDLEESLALSTHLRVGRCKWARFAERGRCTCQDFRESCLENLQVQTESMTPATS
jgi:hypothetical protein